MNFTDKYINSLDAALDNKDNKIVLSNDAYAIGEMIENLINKIENVRLSWLK